MTGFASVPGMSRHAAPARTAFVTLQCCAAVRCRRSGGCCAVTGPLPVSPIALLCVVVVDGSAEATERSRCAAPGGLRSWSEPLSVVRSPHACTRMGSDEEYIYSTPRQVEDDGLLRSDAGLNRVAYARMLATTGVSSYRSDLLTACARRSMGALCAPLPGARGVGSTSNGSPRPAHRHGSKPGAGRAPAGDDTSRRAVRSARDFRLAQESD
jgi:hypothetical protein